MTSYGGTMDQEPDDTEQPTLTGHTEMKPEDWAEAKMLLDRFDAEHGLR